MRKHYEYVAVLVSDDYTKQDINNILTVYYKSIENNFKPSIGTNIDRLSEYDLAIVPVSSEEAIRKMEEFRKNDIEFVAIYDINIMDEYDKRYLTDSNILYITLAKKINLPILHDIYSWVSMHRTIQELY